MTSSCLNAALKFVFHMPRPYWYSTDVHAYSAEVSFGAPFRPRHELHNDLGTPGCGNQAQVVLVGRHRADLPDGVSRLYLAVHFPHDVLLGGCSARCCCGTAGAGKTPCPAPGENALDGKNLVAFGASLALILIGAGTALLLNLFKWQMPADWVTRALEATSGGEPPNPLALDGLISSAGAFFGLALGAVYLFDRGGFETRGPVGQLVLRFLVGLVGVFAIRYGLKAIFPRANYCFPSAALHPLCRHWRLGHSRRPAHLSPLEAGPAQTAVVLRVYFLPHLLPHRIKKRAHKRPLSLYTPLKLFFLLPFQFLLASIDNPCATCDGTTS